MLPSLPATLKTLERRLRAALAGDIDSPRGRARAWLHFNLIDHAFLRVPWTNFDRVAEGVYRSNHPGPRRLRRYRDRGIRAVLNLRGENDESPWMLEQDACRALGLELRVAKIYARKPPGRDELVHLIETMRTMPRPFVMHCKSGADRAGFAAALYAHILDGQPLAQARRHLHWRYLHLASTKTGIVDHILDLYEARLAQGPISLEAWIRDEYDPARARESFARRRRGQPWRAADG